MTKTAGLPVLDAPKLPGKAEHRRRIRQELRTVQQSYARLREELRAIGEDPDAPEWNINGEL